MAVSLLQLEWELRTSSWDGDFSTADAEWDESHPIYLLKVGLISFCTCIPSWKLLCYRQGLATALFPSCITKANQQPHWALKHFRIYNAVWIYSIRRHFQEPPYFDLTHLPVFQHQHFLDCVSSISWSKGIFQLPLLILLALGEIHKVLLKKAFLCGCGCLCVKYVIIHWKTW